MDHLSDEEDNYDDPDEPMMEGSDDEFSDLEIDDDEYDPVDFANPSSPAAQPGSSTLSSGQPSSSTLGGMSPSSPTPPSPPSQPPSNTPSASSSPGKYIHHKGTRLYYYKPLGEGNCPPPTLYWCQFSSRNM